MCLTEALMMLVYVGRMELMDSIMTGQVAMDLVRPWDLYFYWLSRSLGRALYYAVFRGTPLLILSWIFFHIQLPPNGLIAAYFLMSLSLAVLISGAIEFLVNFSAMWTTDARGLAGIVQTLMWFFSGTLLPPEFLPGWLRALVWWLPFQAQGYAPTVIYVGGVGSFEPWRLLALQMLWAVVLSGVAKAMLTAGRRKLAIQGG
jgi:ABC-2 type transport system permease protein